MAPKIPVNSRLQRLLDLRALAEPGEEVDAVELGILVHLGNTLLHRVAHFHSVGFRFLRDADADGEIAVEVTSVFERWLFIAHLGDVLEFESVGPNRKILDLFDRLERAHHAQRPARIAVGDAPERAVEVGVLQRRDDFANVDTMRFQLVDIQIDAHFARVHPVEPHLRHAGNALQRLDNAPLEQIVALGEIALR
jgi:hypothetical protein